MDQASVVPTALWNLLSADLPQQRRTWQKLFSPRLVHYLGWSFVVAEADMDETEKT